ncbi:nacht and wd domain protein, partial [Colletotrichum musicola]
MGCGSLKFWRKRRKGQENTSIASAPSGIPLRSSSAPDTTPTSVPQGATSIAQVSDVSSHVTSTPNVSSSTPAAANAPSASALGDVANASNATISNSVGTLCQPQALPHSSPQSSPSPSRLSDPSSASRQEKLWDRAYKEVQSQEPEIVDAYEHLLSTKLNGIDSPSNKETRNKISDSPKERCEQMRSIAEAGLKKTERSTAVQQKINDGMQVISPLRDVIDQVVKILANQFTEPGINRTGMMHVLSKMQWYMDPAGPQLDEKSSKSQTKLWLQLEDHTVELYQALLLNVVKLDDWNRQLDGIKAAEETVSADLKLSRPSGKGKTMLLCGVIQELEKDPFKRLCYFFCQATEDELSNARSVLRGLIYHLVKQYPRLIQHVREEYDTSGERLFNDHNAWEALCRIFESILADEHLDEILIIVDALDECLVDRPKHLEFISKVSSSSCAKVIVTSRNWPDIEKKLGNDNEHASILPLELNDDLISHAVGKYISWKLDTLARTIPYKNDQEIYNKVRHHLLANSNNTFLWVALVCKGLSSGDVTQKRHVQRVLDKAPPGLDQLYERMIEGISEVAPFDADLCQEILAVTSVLKRPVKLEELLTILDPNLVSDLDPQALKDVIGCCGSFLNAHQGTIYFIHQSAEDFLRKREFTAYPTIEHRHSAVFRRTLDTLSGSTVLRRDTTWKTLGYISKMKFLPNPILWTPSSMVRLEKLVNRNASEEAKILAQLVQDASRFVLYDRITTEAHPLQLYASSLVFSPRGSIVRKLFQDD